GHFNPLGHPHGAPTDAMRHAGDLGNIQAAADGTATLEWTDSAMKLVGPDGVVGHAVIVHANPDDLKTQPTGNAGARAACGVIGIAKGE
ncbi:MAG TPA: superoxide dismutase family protein, partial [Vicinamibacteria bacterium]|nr:superoxide dismutase family protein [Vicinamibacteria bacterium]